MEISARPAGPGDREAVAQLFAESAAATRSERGGALFDLREGAQGAAGPGAAQLESEEGTCLAVGLVDNVILGVALARLETLPDGSRLARIEHLFVDPGAREVGVGTALLDVVSAWAVEGGAEYLDAYALPGNRPAKNFLESSGYVARLIVMSRTLP